MFRWAIGAQRANNWHVEYTVQTCTDKRTDRLSVELASRQAIANIKLLYTPSLQVLRGPIDAQRDETYQTYELTNGLTDKVIWKVASRLVIKTIILTIALWLIGLTNLPKDGRTKLSSSITKLGIFSSCKTFGHHSR